MLFFKDSQCGGSRAKVYQNMLVRSDPVWQLCGVRNGAMFLAEPLP